MKTKEIRGITYRVVEEDTWQDMDILYPNENIYIDGGDFKNILCKNLYCDDYLRSNGYVTCEGDFYCGSDLSITGNLICMGEIYAGATMFCKSDITCGSLYCEENFICYGDLVSYNNIICGGFLNCGGNLRYNYNNHLECEGIVISSYCKWNIVVYKNTIKIGGAQKQTAEWIEFFKVEESYNTSQNEFILHHYQNDREYQLVKIAFEAAVIYQKQLQLMNKPNENVNT